MMRREQPKPQPGPALPPSGTKRTAGGKDKPKPPPIITDYASI